MEIIDLADIKRKHYGVWVRSAKHVSFSEKMKECFNKRVFYSNNKECFIRIIKMSLIDI